MIIVNGTVRFAEGRLGDLKEALARNIAATRAEPGCLSYTYGIDVSEPDVLQVAEQWQDEAAIESHMATPHMAELMAAMGTAIEAISIKSYDARYVRTLLGE